MSLCRLRMPRGGTEGWTGLRGARTPDCRDGALQALCAHWREEILGRGKVPARLSRKDMDYVIYKK